MRSKACLPWAAWLGGETGQRERLSTQVAGRLRDEHGGEERKGAENSPPGHVRRPFQELRDNPPSALYKARRRSAMLQCEKQAKTLTSPCDEA